MKFFVIFTLFYCSYDVAGELYPGFRAKYGTFFNLSRTETETISEGWVSVARADDSHLPSLTMYCLPNDWTFCKLFDDLGYISGVQIALSVQNFTNIPYDLDGLGFTNWSAPAYEGSEAEEFYTMQQYFISEETLNSDAAVRTALRASNKTLYDGGLWIPLVDGSLLKIDNYLAKIDSIWKKQACVPAMGK